MSPPPWPAQGEPRQRPRGGLPGRRSRAPGPVRHGRGVGTLVLSRGCTSAVVRGSAARSELGTQQGDERLVVDRAAERLPDSRKILIRAWWDDSRSGSSRIARRAVSSASVTRPRLARAATWSSSTCSSRCRNRRARGSPSRPASRGAARGGTRRPMTTRSLGLVDPLPCGVELGRCPPRHPVRRRSVVTPGRRRGPSRRVRHTADLRLAAACVAGTAGQSSLAARALCAEPPCSATKASSRWTPGVTSTIPSGPRSSKPPNSRRNQLSCTDHSTSHETPPGARGQGDTNQPGRPTQS